ncbi:hypothetical protein ABIB90_007649 [Bradyrhizobium sp. JR4.1]
MELVRLTSGELRHDSQVHRSIRAIGYGDDVSEVTSNMALWLLGIRENNGIPALDCYSTILPRV